MQPWRVLVLKQVISLSGAKFKRKLTIVKGKVHCFTTFDNSLKILKSKTIIRFRLFRPCRKTK